MGLSVPVPGLSAKSTFIFAFASAIPRLFAPFVFSIAYFVYIYYLYLVHSICVLCG